MPDTIFPNFTARAPWLGPDLQTLRNMLRGPAISLAPDLAGKRLWLLMRDGSGDRLAARIFEPESPRDGAPLLVLVHGLGGSEESSYIAVSTARLLALGYPVLQLNLRGAGPSRPHCREQYHAGRTQDLADAFAALATEHLRDGVVAVGFSLGGNMILKYAAEFGGLRGAVSISAPIDLAAASRRFLDPRNRVYHAHLLKGMKREALAAEAGISDEERALIPTLRSIFEFDERIVAPRNGFESAADYYERCHARRFLAEIVLPTLVIHALDDPWIPAESYASHPWSKNRHLNPLLACGGGHVGFHGKGSRIPWHDRCLEVFLETI